MKKRLFAIGLSCFISLTILAGCGSGGSNNKPSTGTSESVTVEKEKANDSNNGDASGSNAETYGNENNNQTEKRHPVSCIAYDGTEIYYTEDYYYDNENRLIEIVRTNNNGDSPFRIFKAVYDEKGNQIEFYKIYMIGYKDVMTWGYYVYSYDEKGEWISRAYRFSEYETQNPDYIQNVENIYNEDGLLIRRNVSEDYYSEFSYPADGGQVENGYYHGNLMDEFAYDSNGRLVFYSDHGGVDWNPSHIFRFGYDERGNLSSSYKWSAYYPNGELVEDYSIENLYDNNEVLAASIYSSKSNLPDLTLIYNYKGYENTVGMDIASNLQSKGIDGIFEDDKDTYICDEKGNTIASYANGDFSAILAHADGFYLLLKVDSGFEGFTEKIGLLKNDGSWVSNYVTVDNFGLERYAEENVGTRICDEMTGSYGYLGGGVFYYTYQADYMGRSIHIINAEGQKEYNIEKLYYQMGVAQDNVLDESVFGKSDYAAFMVHEPNRIGINVYSKNGLYDEHIDHVFDLGLTNIGGFNEVTDGGFVYWIEDRGEPICIAFYDIASKTSTILYDDKSHINRNRLNEIHFENGKCILYLFGNDYKEYYAVVDKNGKVLVEPQTEFPNLN